MTGTLPELDYILVKGFKSIASAKVELRPITVIIGPNGSGKSNFIGIRSTQIFDIRG